MYNRYMAEPLDIPAQLSLSAFIAGEAHDLKSPFNRILGFHKLVLKGLDGPISDQAREDLTISYQNSQFALQLLSGLIDAARLSEGRYTPSPAVYRLDEVVAQAAQEWKRQSPREKTVEVRLNVRPVETLIDEALLRRSLVYWMNYVLEFVAGPAVLSLAGEQSGGLCLLAVTSLGEPAQAPPVCDITLYGYIALQFWELCQGILRSVESTGHGAAVQLSLGISDVHPG